MKFCPGCQKPKHEQAFGTRTKLCNKCLNADRKFNATGPKKGNTYADNILKNLNQL